MQHYKRRNTTADSAVPTSQTRLRIVTQVLLDNFREAVEAGEELADIVNSLFGVVSEGSLLLENKLSHLGRWGILKFSFSSSANGILVDQAESTPVLLQELVSHESCDRYEYFSPELRIGGRGPWSGPDHRTGTVPVVLRN